MPRTLADELQDRLAEAAAPSAPRFSFLRRSAPIAFTAEASPRRRDRRSDVMVAALGVTLGLICAFFPWYIFFNPEKFGVRAMKFLGNGEYTLTAPVPLTPKPERYGAPSLADFVPPVALDLLPTGTPRRDGDDDEGTPGLKDQPFPALPVTLRLVHVANGRAMIDDGTALFVVERGSLLPDASRVVSIEERDGKGVLITSRDETLVVE